MKEVTKPVSEQTLVERLRNRAMIRRQIPNRKSVQEGQPDRIADLLEEAADALDQFEVDLAEELIEKRILQTVLDAKNEYIKYLESRLMDCDVTFHKFKQEEYDN